MYEQYPSRGNKNINKTVKSPEYYTEKRDLEAHLGQISSLSLLDFCYRNLLDPTQLTLPKLT